MITFVLLKILNMFKQKQNTTINEHTIVVAKTQIPNVPQGSMGTVIHVYENKDTYIVEFTVDDSIVIETVSANQIDEKQ